MATNSKEKQREYSAKWRKNNREKESIRSKEYRKRHADKASFRVKRWQQNNKDRTSKRIMDRCKTDINFKLITYLRSRLYSAMKSNFKAGSAVRDLGCSIQHLKLHLELFWNKGMSWENYGEWHIDHIKPLSKFDLSNREQLLEVCHYTNLQPLWAKDNIRKSDKEGASC